MAKDKNPLKNHGFNLDNRYSISSIWTNYLMGEGNVFSIEVVENLDKKEHPLDKNFYHVIRVGAFSVPQDTSAKEFLENVEKGIEKLVKEKNG